ncbi:putative DNA-3-methyladenine glycosylase YfjP [Drosera capensis]
MAPQQLRQIGVSGRKASYLHDLARKYRDGILSDGKILSMDDNSLFTMLTMVNGIGSWSVHMPDVLPVNDLGIRKGVMLLYGLEELPRPSQMEQLCEKWRPYRSVASWYIWRFVEAKGSSSSAAAQQQGQQQQHELQVLQQEQQPTAAQFIDSMAGMMNMRCAWGHSM